MAVQHPALSSFFRPVREAFNARDKGRLLDHVSAEEIVKRLESLSIALNEACQEGDASAAAEAVVSIAVEAVHLDHLHQQSGPDDES